MSIGKELLKGSITRVSQTLVNVLIAFLMMPFLVSSLGEHWYGIWTIIASLTASYHLFDLGMASAVTRYISHDLSNNNHSQANKTINTALRVYILISLVLAIFSVILSTQTSYFIDAENDEIIVSLLVLITGLSVALEFPFNAFAGIAQARLKFHHVALVRILISLLNALLLWIFLSNGFGLLAMGIITFFTARLSNIAYFLVSKKAFPELKINLSLFHNSRLRELFSFSIWAFVIAICFQLRHSVDSFVIGYFISATMVTYYFIGQSLIIYLGEILNQATNLFVPIFTQFHARKEVERLHRSIVFATKLNFCLAIIAATLLTLVAKPFITLWMGDKFEESYSVALVLLGAITINFTIQPLVSSLFAVNRHKLIAKLDSIEVAFNLLISIFLVQKIGILGVAIGTLVPALAIKTFILPYYGCKNIELPLRTYYGSFIRPLLASIIPIYLSFLLTQHFYLDSYISILVILFSSGLLFLLFLLPFGFSKHEQVKLLKLAPISKSLKLFDK